MKIVIIGAGWVGCHLAKTFMNDHEITLIDKNDNFFNGTSKINQNRLHLGYHYARNKSTRELCIKTFNRFILEYGHLTKPIGINLYAVSKNESLLDFGTIQEIFNCQKWDHTEWSAPFLCNTEAVINTKEKFISPIKAQKFFSNNLSKLFKTKNVIEKDFNFLCKDNDVVIDCTNNSLIPISSDDYFELVAMFLYTQKSKLPFDALTFIDGPLFSLFPYENDMLSLSHVEHSVICKSKSLIDFKNFYCNTEPNRIEAENHLIRYWPEAKNYLSYKNTVFSIKSKSKNLSAFRSPVFRQVDNFFSCFTGKIQGIYEIEDYFRKIII